MVFHGTAYFNKWWSWKQTGRARARARLLVTLSKMALHARRAGAASFLRAAFEFVEFLGFAQYRHGYDIANGRVLSLVIFNASWLGESVCWPAERVCIHWLLLPLIRTVVLCCNFPICSLAQQPVVLFRRTFSFLLSVCTLQSTITDCIMFITSLPTGFQRALSTLRRTAR